jgi:LysM repeat protein
MPNYKIKKGDTLSAIAKKEGTTVSKLMSLNPQIKDKNMIMSGVNLNLPYGMEKLESNVKSAPAKQAVARMNQTQAGIKAMAAQGATIDANKKGKSGSGAGAFALGAGTALATKGIVKKSSRKIKEMISNAKDKKMAGSAKVGGMFQNVKKIAKSSAKYAKVAGKAAGKAVSKKIPFSSKIINSMMSGKVKK